MKASNLPNISAGVHQSNETLVPNISSKRDSHPPDGSPVAAYPRFPPPHFLLISANLSLGFTKE